MQPDALRRAAAEMMGAEDELRTIVAEMTAASFPGTAESLLTLADVLHQAGARIWDYLDAGARDVQLFSTEEAEIVVSALADYRDEHRVAARLIGGGSDTARATTRSADLADAIRLRVWARHPEVPVS